MKKSIGTLFVVAATGLAVTVSMAALTPGESTVATYKDLFAYSAATGNIAPTAASPPVTERLLEHGHWVYRGMCVGCHGVSGEGNGAVWELGEQYAGEYVLPRKPRDFTLATFKVRSTPSGSLPTDTDLFKAISRGLVADQDMPSFKFLPERDRWAVVAYIKSLSERWEEEAEFQEDPIEIAEPPLPDETSVEAGREVYAQMKCAKCHGPEGKGDGPSAPELEDDNGLSIEPRDFSDPAQFVGASDPKGVYQTFITGLDGTPMPSFADFLDEDARWQLVWFVMSLRPGWSVEQQRRDLEAERAASMASLDDDAQQ